MIGGGQGRRPSQVVDDVSNLVILFGACCMIAGFAGLWHASVSLGESLVWLAVSIGG